MSVVKSMNVVKPDDISGFICIFLVTCCLQSGDGVKPDFVFFTPNVAEFFLHNAFTSSKNLFLLSMNSIVILFYLLLSFPQTFKSCTLTQIMAFLSWRIRKSTTPTKDLPTYGIPFFFLICCQLSFTYFI